MYIYIMYKHIKYIDMCFVCIYIYTLTNVYVFTTIRAVLKVYIVGLWFSYVGGEKFGGARG